jgi:hypothetical protein
LAGGETLTTPVYAGVPGALPRDFKYIYDASLRGWPVRAIDAQHPIRGAFLDPRGSTTTASPATTLESTSM